MSPTPIPSGNPDILARVRGLYESALNSPAYRAWLEEARLAWDFYDGAQWSAEEVNRLSDMGQPAIVINKIAAKIDNIAGTEVAGRTRITFRSRSGVGQEEQAARVLTDLFAFIAERTDLPQETSRVFRAGLVSGIGWLEVAAAEEAAGAGIMMRCEAELDVVFDPLARAADFSDARFVARHRWLDEEGVKALFGNEGETLVATLRNVGSGRGMTNANWAAAPAEVPYYDARRELFRIVEVQYRAHEPHWRVRMANGRTEVFVSRVQARRAAARKGALGLESFQAPKAFVAYFSGAQLLHHAPLGTPEGSFTLLPYVYKRHAADGRPYGLVRGAIDPQRELNKRRSKAMHLLNTAQVIADIDAVDDPTVLAREAARPDGLILKRAGKDLRIIRNADLAASQVAVMEQAGRDIQDVMGVFDEAMGKPTNAQSGAAIQQRQLAGTLNQMFAFDALRRLKKALGRHVLGLIRVHFSAEMVLRITDDLSAARQVKLLGEGEGPDATAVFDVVVEEVGEALSARDIATLQAHRPDLIGA